MPCEKCGHKETVAYGKLKHQDVYTCPRCGHVTDLAPFRKGAKAFDYFVQRHGLDDEGSGGS